MIKIVCGYKSCNKDCKHYNLCELHINTNKYQLKLQKEINYKLKKLKEVKKQLNEYKIILKEIIDNDYKYSGTVNVYGNIKHYPKQNIHNVHIRKPEHVRYGFNHYHLLKRKNELIESIRELRIKQYKNIEGNN